MSHRALRLAYMDLLRGGAGGGNDENLIDRDRVPPEVWNLPLPTNLVTRPGELEFTIDGPETVERNMEELANYIVEQFQAGEPVDVIAFDIPRDAVRSTYGMTIDFSPLSRYVQYKKLINKLILRNVRFANIINLPNIFWQIIIDNSYYNKSALVIPPSVEKVFSHTKGLTFTMSPAAILSIDIQTMGPDVTKINRN